MENCLVLYNRVFSYMCNVECASDFPCCYEVLFMSPTGIAVACYLQPHQLQVIFLYASSCDCGHIGPDEELPTTFQIVLRLHC